MNSNSDPSIFHHPTIFAFLRFLLLMLGHQAEVINPLFLLTAKPVVFLINLSEKDYIRQKNKHLAKIAEWVKTNAPGDPIIPLSVSFEERLTRFKTEGEAEEECKKLGTKSALPKIITTMRAALNLGSFFTTGSDEVRQWTIRKGTKAPQAAGVIHGGMHFHRCTTYRSKAADGVQILKRHSFSASYTTMMRCANMGMKLRSGQPERS
jgi:ribosome-binding ATPase YchF (GTP1/OBG family)